MDSAGLRYQAAKNNAKVCPEIGTIPLPTGMSYDNRANKPINPIDRSIEHVERSILWITKPKTRH